MTIINSNSQPNQDQVTENELDSFRQRWIEEVNSVTGLSTTTQHQHQLTSSTQPIHHSPLIIYAQAVYYERTGLLDDALVHYRKALRLEPNIDRAYHLLNPDQIDSLEQRWINKNLPDPTFNFSRSLHVEQDTHTPYPSTDHNQLGQSHRLDQIHGALHEKFPPDSQHPSSTTRLLNYLISSFENNPWQRQPPKELDNHNQELSNHDPESKLINGLENQEIEDQSISQIDQQLSNLQIKSSDPVEEERTPKPSSAIGLSFEPMDLELGCPIQRLPAEMFNDHILSLRGYRRSTIHLLVGTIETFARVSRFARLLTLGSSIWRAICLSIYTHDLFVNRRLAIEPSDRPNLVESLCQKSHDHDWRRMYIEQPRVRLDGCYISLVRYPRLGESANPWYTPTHFVTYFRYLRFLEDGRCMSYTSTDEPGQVVRSLGWPILGSNVTGAGSSTSSTMSSGGNVPGGKILEGVLFGMWTLEEDRVKLFKLHQDPRRLPLTASSSRRMPPLFHDRPAGRASYEFEIEAKLLSTRRGKMNKLEILRLSTINLNTGELLDVPLPSAPSSSSENNSDLTSFSSSKPFIFSRVVAYDPL